MIQEWTVPGGLVHYFRGWQGLYKASGPFVDTPRTTDHLVQQEQMVIQSGQTKQRSNLEHNLNCGNCCSSGCNNLNTIVSQYYKLWFSDILVIKIFQPLPISLNFRALQKVWTYQLVHFNFLIIITIFFTAPKRLHKIQVLCSDDAQWNPELFLVCVLVMTINVAIIVIR